MKKPKRFPLTLTLRRGTGMAHRPGKPTTSTASVERKDTKRIHAAIRVDDAKTVRGIGKEDER